MSLKTPLCDMLGIEHPIMLAGMGGVSYAEVCAAVSEAGGFGCLGMAGLSVDEIQTQVRKVKELTNRPFGLDLLAAVPESLERTADIMIEEGITAFVSGLGVPVNILERLHSADILVMNVCGAVSHAVSGAAAGVDAVIAQGTEAGGHTGRVAGMALIPQITDAVDIPVIAAGSIVDGRGLVAALAFGCQGVWMGTRFIASEEAHAADMYKQVVLDADDRDTIITRCYSGKPMRVHRNPYVDNWENRPQEIKPFPEQAIISHKANVMGGIGGQIEGLDKEKSCFAMGQGAGAIHDVLPCRDIINRTITEAEAIIEKMQAVKV
ncbi:MAG: nitronate monooxygenase [Parvularculales bacterium]